MQRNLAKELNEEWGNGWRICCRTEKSIWKAYKFRDEQTRQEGLVRRCLDGLRDSDARFEVEHNKEPENIDEAAYHVVNFVQT